MAWLPLENCRVLVAEDEYMLAQDLCACLHRAGATILGPVPSVQHGLALARGASTIDGAALDINLSGEPVFPLADLLLSRGVTIVFTTGYDQSAIPSRFADVPCYVKPLDTAALTRALQPSTPH